MSIEKLWTKSRADRLTDPDIQRNLNEEWTRTRESFGNLGNQTKATCTSILYNTLVRPITSTARAITTGQGEKTKQGLPGTVSGGVESAEQLFKLVGRVLMATGRVAKYGVRRALVI